MARYALVVGITEYENFQRLPKAATDAEAIARIMRRHHYDVTLLPRKLLNNEWVFAQDASLTCKVLGEELQNLLRKRGRHEALIYIAGHGFKATNLMGKEKGYLATSDSKRDGTNAIHINDLNDLIRESDLSSLVLLLDCCHAGFMVENKDLMQSTKIAVGHKHNYCLIAACRDFEKAREGEIHGIFTEAILKGLSPKKAIRGEINSSDLLSSTSRDLRNSGQEVIQASSGLPISILNFPDQRAVIKNFEEDIDPYRGLEAFEKGQAKFFFGRRKVVEDIRLVLDKDGFVALIGASGSGKSSVMRAGLIPWLEANGWEILDPIKPGFEPLVELRKTFLRYFKDTTKERQLKSFIEDAKTYPNGLVDIVDNLPSQTKFLLIIDQFEELLTLCPDEEEKQRFIQLITQVTRTSKSCLYIAITIRADFFRSCLEYTDLTSLLNQYLVLMPPLVREDLEEAIRKPAEILGYQFDMGLLAAIFDDVGKERGCLPLLQFTLKELWRSRDTENRLLKLEEYKKLGGVIGSLNRRANEIYQSLDQQDKIWARQLFLYLIQINANEPSTRQRQPKDEIIKLLLGHESNFQNPNKSKIENKRKKQKIEDLIDKFVQERLLVTDIDGEVVWVDLVHEALIEQWTEFSDWQQRERIRRQVELRRQPVRQKPYLEPLTTAQQELYNWIFEYIQNNDHPPSIRQMMRAMNLRSPAPIQSRLEHLKSKGYIDWGEGKARTIQIIHSASSDVPVSSSGIPILGVISTQSLTEVFPYSEIDHIDFSEILLNPNCFALEVRGQGMIDELVNHGDIAVMESILDPNSIKNGSIVAVLVENKTILRCFSRKGDKIILKSGNENQEEYPTIEFFASQVNVQGSLIGVWRSHKI